MRASERRILTVAAALLLSGPVAAWPADTKPNQELSLDDQRADKPKDEKPKERAPDVASAASDGFVIQFENGEYKLILGMVAQADGRFSLDDPKPIINTFTIRKIRPTFTGRITRWFTFKVMPDFGNGTTIVQDAYFDIRFSPAFRLRTGKDKTPVGYELLEGHAFLLFPERALASSLVPNRDSGSLVPREAPGPSSRPSVRRDRLRWC